MKQILLTILIIGTLACKQKQVNDTGRTGTYSGLIKYGNFNDFVSFDIERDSSGFKVFFSSLAQNANRIPFRDITVHQDSISFVLRSDFYTYIFRNKWTSNNSQLEGLLRVDSIEVPYLFKKEQAGKGQKPGNQDISFTSNGHTLNGTIWYPEQPSDQGLVLISSSGNADRSASRAEAILFAEKGFTTFHYDKRGTGKSEGNWEEATMQELVSDDVNAIRHFSKSTGLSLSNVGIKGSSQGGAKVPHILTELSELKYGIAVSCPGTSLLESDLNFWKNRNKENLNQKLLEATDLQRKVFEYIAGKIERADLENQIALQESEEWFKYVWIPNLDEVRIDTKLNYSSIPFFEKTEQPVLILQGTLDEIIPLTSHQNISDALTKGNNSDFDSYLLQGANHSMYYVGDSDFPYWAKLHPEYLKTVVDWINTVYNEG